MTKNQFGLRPKLSTLDVLINAMEDTQNECEVKPKVTHVSFIDIKKGFDTGSHDTLLDKAEKCGLI